MTNLSIFARNTLAGLTDEAGALYLRGADRDEGRAFRCACEWQDRLEPMLSPLSARAADILAEQRPHLTEGATRAKREVVEFIRERQFRRYFPDGRSAPAVLAGRRLEGV